MAQNTTSTSRTTATQGTIAIEQAPAFTGMLSGLVAGELLSWGLLEALSLFPASQPVATSAYVAPLEHLKVVKVPTYGTVVLHNTATQGTLVAPMHIGFFQSGAQNHATSRVLILAPGELLEADDCFCVQQSQGGFLQEAQQRFLMLPLGLRRSALDLRKRQGYSRLWQEIEDFSRRFGITRGGHLERFLRPNFARLVPLRHALETQPGHVGAAYFIGGRLAGIEVAPNAAYWEDLFPVLTIYCYGPAALMAERRKWTPVREQIGLDNLCDVADLEQRLMAARRHEKGVRTAAVQSLSAASWNLDVDEERHGLRVLSAAQEDWRGQVVRDADGERVYLSLFRDVTLQSAG